MKEWWDNPRPKSALAIMRYGQKCPEVKDTKHNFNLTAYFQLAKLILCINHDSYYVIYMPMGGEKAKWLSSGFLLEVKHEHV